MNTSPWAPYRPTSAAPWNLERAWTLRRRAGFAATWRELERDVSRRPGPGRRQGARGRMPERRGSGRVRPYGGPARRRGRGRLGRPQAPGVVALPGAVHARPALRTAHADVARPLRDQPAQGGRRRRDARAERDVSAPRPRPVRRLAPRDAPRPCLARLARRPIEPQGEAQRKPRPRVAGAVHARAWAVTPKTTSRAPLGH